MVWLVFAIIVTLGLFIALGVYHPAPKTLGWKLKARQVLSLAGLLLVLGGCVASVPTGHTGVVTTFGKVENTNFEAGVHFKLPWQEVVVMDNRNQKATLDLSCFSSDIQEVDVRYTVNYQIEKINAQKIYKGIGANYFETVMTPRIQEAVKSVIAKYNAEKLIESREILSSEIKSILTNKLSVYNIEILDASIENLDFSDAFTDAVEAKQVAEQNKLKAAIEQAQKVLEAEAEAQRNVIGAEADAKIAEIKANADLEVAKIQADAAYYAGEKDAAVNQKIAESLTEELLVYYYIMAWNGELPETYIGTNDFYAIFQALVDAGKIPPETATEVLGG